MFGALTNVKGIRIEVNAYHLHIYKDGKKVWQRTPEMPEWYDETHQKIVKGLDALESIVGKIEEF